MPPSTSPQQTGTKMRVSTLFAILCHATLCRMGGGVRANVPDFEALKRDAFTAAYTKRVRLDGDVAPASTHGFGRSLKGDDFDAVFEQLRDALDHYEHEGERNLIFNGIPTGGNKYPFLVSMWSSPTDDVRCYSVDSIAPLLRSNVIETLLLPLKDPERDLAHAGRLSRRYGHARRVHYPCGMRI